MARIRVFFALLSTSLGASGATIPGATILVAAALLALSIAPGSPPVSGEPPEPPAIDPQNRHEGSTEGSPESTPGGQVEGAAPGAPPGHRDVRQVRRLIPGGGRVAWSAQGDLLAFDRLGEDDLYDVWVIPAPGPGGAVVPAGEETGDGETAGAPGDETAGERCLTCALHELRNAHAFNPVWHPSGDFVVIQVQERGRQRKAGIREMASPLRVAASTLWLVDRSGRRGWQLTQPQRGGSPMDPRFSFEGGRLMWSERVAADPRPWGRWLVRVGQLKIQRGVPRLSRVETVEPGERPGLVIALGFTPDDRAFVFATGDLEAGPALATWDFDSKTRSPFPTDGGVTGEAVAFVPGRDTAVVASDLSLPREARRGLRSREVWLVGRGLRERLTFFHHPRSDHPLGDALVDDLAFSPTGDRFVAHVVSPGAGGGVTEDVWLVVLDEEYRR